MWYAGKRELRGEILRKLRYGSFTTPLSGPWRQYSRGRGREWCERVVRPKAELFEAFGCSELCLSEVHRVTLREADTACSAVPVRMGGPGDTDLLFSLVRSLHPRNILETGVAYGWSSLAILLGLEDLGEGRLVSLDMPYAKMGNEAYVGTAVPKRLRIRWDLRRLPDAVGLRQLKAEGMSFDFAHYDSDKSYLGRSRSYREIWDMLTVGGILMSDDIADNLGFRDFALRVGRTPWVVRKGTTSGFVGLLRK
ncbi:MAG: O-methyltransferase [Myxococcota bacterium]